MPTTGNNDEQRFSSRSTRLFGCPTKQKVESDLGVVIPAVVSIREARVDSIVAGCNQGATTSVLPSKHHHKPPPAGTPVSTSLVGRYKVLGRPGMVAAVLMKIRPFVWKLRTSQISFFPDPFHHPVRKTKTKTMPDIIIDSCHTPNPNSPTSYHHQPPVTSPVDCFSLFRTAMYQGRA